jgi:hypothetical protein
MPLQQLQFRPGVNREGTTLANEGGWFECDKVRFRSGYPQKIGGWAALSYNTFLGVCRSLWNWITLKSFNLCGVGTNLKFYIEYGGVYYDVTPIRAVTTNTATFAATAGSNIVVVTDPNNGIKTGDFVTFTGAKALSIQTVTITVGVPTIINLTSALPNGTAITLATTGNLPTGLTVGTTYYVVNASGVTCNLALTVGGAALPTVGGQSGTQTLSNVAGMSAAVLNSEFQVTYISANSYSIIAPTTATVFDTGNGGSNIVATYQIETGGAVYTIGTGWGAGPWNAGSAANAWAHGWGTAYTSGVGAQLRLWSQANFGEYLLFNPRGGAIYLWTPGLGDNPAVDTPGEVLSIDSAGIYETDANCPVVCNTLAVSDSARIVLAFGCNDYGETELDPLLIRWSDQESYSVWTPQITNQAGSYRLSRGSLIVTATQTRQEILVWTDTALYSMQYSGPPFVWQFTLLADNLSLIGPNASSTVNGVTYWMGTDKFYVYSGRIETLPCTLRQYVFEDINRDQGYQVYSGTNEGYSEIWWFYCSANSTVADRYVIYNYLDKVWYYGNMGRTAWLDSPLRSYPMGVTYDNLIVYHEAAVDDGTTNPPTAISSYIQSSDFDIGDGHNYGFVWRVVPDITFDGSTTAAPNFPNVNFTVRPRQNPGSLYGSADSPIVTTALPYGTVHNYNVQQFTEIVYTRIRGRQLAFKIESNTLGTQWQLGVPRIDVKPDGRR